MESIQLEKFKFLGLEGHITHYEFDEAVEGDVFVNFRASQLEDEDESLDLFNWFGAAIRMNAYNLLDDITTLNEYLLICYNFFRQIKSKYQAPSEYAQALLGIMPKATEEALDNDKMMRAYDENFLSQNDVRTYNNNNQFMSYMFNRVLTSLVWIISYKLNPNTGKGECKLVPDIKTFFDLVAMQDMMAMRIQEKLFCGNAQLVKLFREVNAIDAFYQSARRYRRYNLIKLDYPSVCIWDAPVEPDYDFCIRDNNLRLMVAAANKCLKQIGFPISRNLD